MIATIHTQARYMLLGAVKKFTDHYPNAQLRLRQGNPTQIAELLAAGDYDKDF